MSEAWMTGAMMIDQITVEFFMAVAAATNDSPDSGVSVVYLPVETSAAAQAETQASANTGTSSVYSWPMHGGGGGSGVYPI